MSWLKDWIYGRREDRVVPFPEKCRFVYFAREVAPGCFEIPRLLGDRMHDTEIVCEFLDGRVERRFYKGRPVVM